MKDRNQFSRYVYRLHERINKNLGKDSGLSYCDVRERYEHFRARCTEEKPKMFDFKKTRKNKTLKKRWFFSSLVLAAVLGLSACAGPQVADYTAEKPVLDLRQYFNGTIDAYGIFTDRSGRVVKRFTVVMTCS